MINLFLIKFSFVFFAACLCGIPMQVRQGKLPKGAAAITTANISASCPSPGRMQLAGLQTLHSLPRAPLNTLSPFVTTHSLTNTIPSLQQLHKIPQSCDTGKHINKTSRCCGSNCHFHYTIILKLHNPNYVLSSIAQTGNYTF